MKPVEISDRVRQEADACFGETIEHLLRLLMESHDSQNNSNSHFIRKWMATGLLDTIAEEDRDIAARVLEGKAHILVVESMSPAASRMEDNSWDSYVAEQLLKSIACFLPKKCYCDALTWYDPVTFTKKKRMCEHCKKEIDKEWEEVNNFRKIHFKDTLQAL